MSNLHRKRLWAGEAAAVPAAPFLVRVKRRAADVGGALALSVLLFAASGLVPRSGAQSWNSRGGLPDNYVRIEGGQVVNEDELRTARETKSHATDTPNWTNSPAFKHDVFTFARVIFKSDPGQRPGRGDLRRLGWWVDYPDADLNLSFRLQQLTSIRTDPDARVLKLTSPDLCDYPLLFLEHAGYMLLNDDEIAALKNYLASGGALFVTDFWGDEEWNGFAAEIAKVLPGRQWTELTAEHPLFQCVFPMRGPLNRFQVPTLQFWNELHDPQVPGSPLQTFYRGEGSETVHARVLLDDQERIQVLAILNSDVSDGWERESQNVEFFNQFSERIAYPLAMNVVFYLMTH